MKKSIFAKTIEITFCPNVAYYSFMKYFIKNKVKIFFVPYGVANHLNGWGVRQESIIELTGMKVQTLMASKLFVCLHDIFRAGVP